MNKFMKKATTFAMTGALAVSMLFTAGSPVFAEGESEAATNLLDGVTWEHVHKPYENNDAGIAGTRVSENDQGGFTANITMTGWQREWYGVDYMPDDAWPWQGGWCDNPYQLNSNTDFAVSPKSTYELSFDIENAMKDGNGNATEKNVTVTINSGIEGDNDNTLMFTTVRVEPNGTLNFDKKFTVPEGWSLENAHIQIAYGAYAYSYEISASPFLKLMPEDIIKKYCFAPGTKENVNALGKLSFNNLSIVQVPYEEPTTEAPTTKASEQVTTKAPEQATTVAPAPSLPAPSSQVKVDKPSKPAVKAVNVKGKKIKVSWKKINTATKYQVRAVAGKKKITKTTAKTSITLKKLTKKKTYKVSVRAYNTAGYGAWSSAKKVKIKK